MRQGEIAINTKSVQSVSRRRPVGLEIRYSIQANSENKTTMASLLQRRDINDNTALPDLKKIRVRRMSDQASISPSPRVECENMQRAACRQLRKRRSSIALETEGHHCKSSTMASPEVSGSTRTAVQESPQSGGIAQTPVTTIRNIFDGFVITRRRSSSESSSSSSEFESEPPCQVFEEVIQPTQVSTEEAVLKYPAQVRHPTTNEQWKASSLGSGSRIIVSYDAGSYALYAWDIGNGNYVFGFQGSGSTYYVKTPDNGTGYLTLTTAGDDPTTISNPASDHRCMTYAYSNHTASYHLHPAHNTSSLWIGFNSRGYAAVMSSMNDAKSWDISSV